MGKLKIYLHLLKRRNIICDFNLKAKKKTEKMKLLVHNMLTSNMKKGVTKGFPLRIEVGKLEEKESEALVLTATEIGKGESLPPSLPENYADDETFLRHLHHVLLEVELLEVNLVCPESGRKFPVSNGIPNMLLNEDEVRS